MISVKIKIPKIAKILELLSSQEFYLKDVDIFNYSFDTVTIYSQNDLDDFEFIGCRLHKAVFSHIPHDVSFTDCMISASNCSNLVLHYKSVIRCNFLETKLTGWNVEEALISDVTFSNCDFTLSSFVNTHFQNVIFRDCILDDVRFFACKIESVVFENCQIKHLENIHTPLKDVDFSNSTLIGGTFYPEDLKGLIINSDQAILLVKLLGVIVNT